MPKALWDARYPTAILQRRRREMGTLAYDKEYMCTPRSSESSIFPMELFEANFDPAERLIKEYNPTTDEKEYIVAQGWDVAIGLEGDTDYNVGFTIGLDKDGDRHILDIVRVRHLKTYRRILKLMEEKALAYKARIMIVENNSFQRIFEQELAMTTALPIYGHTTGREKSDLIDGVPGLRILLENKKYHIPRGSSHSVSVVDTWISECEAFGWQDDTLTGVGEHDDTVMAWWFAEIGMKRLTERPSRAGRPGIIGATLRRKGLVR